MPLWVAWVACGRPAGPDDAPTPDASPSTSSADTGTPVPDPPPAPFVAASVGLHPDLPTLVVVDFTLQLPASVHCEVRFGDGEVRASPVRYLQAGPHQDVVLGVPYAVAGTLALTGVPDGGREGVWQVAVQTGPVPATLPVPALRLVDATATDPTGEHVLVSVKEAKGSRWWVMLVDRQGRVVWAMRSPPRVAHLHPRVGLAGDSFLVDHNRFYGGDFALTGSTVQRIRIDGTVVGAFDVPGLHQAFTELPDGAVAYPSVTSFAPDHNDELLRTVHPDGTAEVGWSCRAWQTGLGLDRYCGSNSLAYDAGTDSFLVSLYTVDTVVEVDGASQLASHWFGSLVGAWAFDPPESAFAWQHGPYRTAQGTLLLSTRVSSSVDETVIREYALDPGAQTLRQVWSFGQGEGLYADNFGEALRLPDGNTLQNTGTLPRLREITPDGEVVWDLAWSEGHELGRSTFVGALEPFMDRSEDPSR